MYTDKQKEFRKENLRLWEEKILEIFCGTIPAHAEWTDKKEIVSLLNQIGIQNLNHMMYPDCGGLDIVGCSISSVHSGMIEILTNGETPNICSPQKLLFDCIEGSPEWGYFRLELNQIDSSGLYNEKDVFVEELYEYGEKLEPYSEYAPDGEYRHILRVLKGCLLIVPKTCYYNHLPNTYTGLHNKYDNVTFKSKMKMLKGSAGYKKFLKDME